MANETKRYYSGGFVCPFCLKKTRVLYIFRFRKLYAQICHICFRYNNSNRDRYKKS